jgi:osmotically-inducible protein OsmY
MLSMKHFSHAAIASLMLILSSLNAQAADLAAQLSEARQEGSIWTALSLNRHLNAFRIGVDVEQGTAVLTGTVESPVDRELAEQVALSIEGIERVDNQLRLDPTLDSQPSTELTLAQQLEDITLSATIKSKLLWNSQTEGLDVKVATRAGVVTLTGEARSAEAKELAGQLALGTQGVSEVNNLLSISQASTAAGDLQRQADAAAEQLDDGWITSKIKASYLVSNSLDGLSIAVETKDGMVRLRGRVGSQQQKTQAVETARNIRGVRGVDADALLVQAQTL